MNKVTKLLLVASVAAVGAIGFNACGDSVTVVEPAPPPPPPPPPPPVTEEATVTIQGLRIVATGLPANPTAIAGDINVILNVDEKDETITDISLTLDGIDLGCQTVSASVGDAGTASVADEVECFLDSDALSGVCEGLQLDPTWNNGEHVLGAQIVTSGGATRTAANEQTLNFMNSNFVEIVPFGTFQSVVGANGIRYYGGPADLDGDGTDDNVVQFAACPVRYDDTVISEVWVRAFTDDGAANADLGDGPGATQEDGEAPFIFTVDYEDNENVVEDFPTGQGANGHTIIWVAALDDAGVDVSLSFNCPGVTCAANDLYVDMTDPALAGEALQLDGAAVMNTWYSEGDYNSVGVTDAGVGFLFGSGAQVDVADCTDWTADDFDADVFAANQVDLDGHPEDDWEEGGDGFAGADAGGVDCYNAFVQNLADELGNAVDRAVLTASNLFTADYGVDRTPADITDRLPEDGENLPPVINPDITNDGACAAGECIFTFTAEDPDLESDDPGSQVDNTGLPAVADGSVAVPIEVESDDGTAGGTANHFLTEVAAGDFEINIEPAGLGTGLPADGDYTITITIPDNATPANEAEDVFTVTLDNTAPVIGALNPAPVGSPGTDASSIVMTIGETVDDANVLTVVDLTVTVNGTDAAGTAPTVGGCAAAAAAANLYTLSVAGGKIDRNVIDLSNGTNEVDFSGANAESFTITEPAGAVNPVQYCFVIDAEDEALDIDGTAAPNVSQLVTQVDVTWNP